MAEPFNRDELLILCNQDLSLSKIAKSLGCRVSTVKELIAEYKIDRKPLKSGPMKGKHRNKICPICGTVFDDVYKNDKTYCSRKCQLDNLYYQYINRWLVGLEDGMSGQDGISNYVRRYLFEKYNNSCQKCGWSEVNLTTGNIPLTINHIDGNFANSTPNNLELLCPNCHSLTSNYGSLNKGNGRPKRRKD